MCHLHLDLGAQTTTLGDSAVFQAQTSSRVGVHSFLLSCSDLRETVRELSRDFWENQLRHKHTHEPH